MNSADDGTPRPPVPRGVNPWAWMLAGLAATAAALAWARVADSANASDGLVRFSVVFCGVLAAGIAIWQRCAWPTAPGLGDLAQPLRGRLLLLAAIANGLAALAVTLVLVLKFNQPDLPGEKGGTILLWILAAPWCGWSAWKLLQRSRDEAPLGRPFETAVLVTQGGIAAFMGSWAFYWGPELSEEWDSLRLFLAVLAAAAFLCAPIVACSPPVRRLAVTGLLALHFAALASVVLGMQPGPWILAHTQHWVFGKYLDFMYLNNGYRFYSPEPSPASQLWCRIEYKQGDQFPYRWVKLPEMDDRGRTKLPGLQYTRRLALTESVARTDPPPPLVVRGKDGEMVPADFVLRRELQTPNPTMLKMGMPAPSKSLKIPMHPDPSVPPFQKPNFEGQMLLSSYARHLLAMPPPSPDARPLSVKIYRVQHRILGAEMISRGADPWDLTLYLPYYNGQFDTSGRLMDPGDPFLYWVLPILRKNEMDPKSPLLCYVFKHAGDTDWEKLP